MRLTDGPMGKPGHPARRRTSYGANALAEALTAELKAWKKDEQNPVSISTIFGKEMHVESTTRKLLTLFNLSLNRDGSQRQRLIENANFALKQPHDRY